VLWPGDECYPIGTTPIVPGQSQKPTDANIAFETVALDERMGPAGGAIVLAQRPGGGASPGLMVQVFANANPGAAEIDVQDAAVDADGAYQTPTGSAAYKMTVWTQEGAIWTSFSELIPEAKFVTLLIVANPNAVAFWAKATYV
jgi:hypothetical protein